MRIIVTPPEVPGGEFKVEVEKTREGETDKAGPIGLALLEAARGLLTVSVIEHGQCSKKPAAELTLATLADVKRLERRKG